MTAMSEKDQSAPTPDLEAMQLAAQSRAAQGLPPMVTDRTVLRMVADLFCAEDTAEPVPATPRARRRRGV
jgi:hypothetical protein